MAAQEWSESSDDTGSKFVHAAQYLRMSTEHQQYSTQNQADAIASYAEQRGFKIVRTYGDEGKSGLRLSGRSGLSQLIQDVEAGTVNFSIVLVYDVSRWGRFQDADESAYYEYICKRAGIVVEYCAEQFDNDGSPVSTIVKSVKRAMAGEYSRELSAKVFAGQCRLIELGYRQGGAAGFGLRRMLIDQDGNRKGQLSIGEHKSLQTDRVILVPGPDEEINTVHSIYRMFVEEELNEGEIAQRINAMSIRTDLDRLWTRGSVHQILTNEKYIGNNVFNRSSFKLKQRHVTNSPDMWVRAEGAFDAIVDASLFFTAQGIIKARSRRFSDSEMLDRLKYLYERQGQLSGMIIDEHDNLPSSACYRSRFGSLVRAYRLVGFTPSRDYRYLKINKALRLRHPKILADTKKSIEHVGGSIVQDPETDMLTINGEYSASIVVTRCKEMQSGRAAWHLRFDASLAPDITVVIRMDATNTGMLDYYLLPRIDVLSERLRFHQDNSIELDAYRFDNLDFFFSMARRAKFAEAA
jgi:DNA invertase Pin-like site-specific DNA recombinase